MLLNNTRPAGQPASDRGGSMKRKVNLRLSKTCLVFQFPSFCLTFPLAAVFLLCQRGFLTTPLTFTKRNGREQTMPSIGWQGKNTDFTKTFNQFIHGSQPQETVAMKFLLRQRRSKKAEIGQRNPAAAIQAARSEEHTSELQSRFDLVCRLLLEKK